MICVFDQRNGAAGMCNGKTNPTYDPYPGEPHPVLIDHSVTYQPVDEWSGFGGGPFTYIHAYRQSFYDVLWRWFVPGTGSLVTASPFALAAESGVIIVGTSEYIYGLRSGDGHELWQWGPDYQLYVNPDTQDYPFAISAG